MFGGGLPVALQKRVWLLPSRTTGLDGAQTIILLSERKVVQEIQIEVCLLCYGCTDQKTNDLIFSKFIRSDKEKETYFNRRKVSGYITHPE